MSLESGDHELYNYCISLYSYFTINREEIGMTESTESSMCALSVRIAFAIIGILVGVSIFFTFGIVYYNWDTAIWGLLSGILAAATLVVHVKYKENGWRFSPQLLKPIMLAGCFAQLVSICGFVAYISIAVTEAQPLTPYGPKGYYLASVWCFMSWKWAFLLFLYSRKYKKIYEHECGHSADAAYEKI